VHWVADPLQLDGEHCPLEQLWLALQWPRIIQPLPSGLHCSTDWLGPHRSAPAAQRALSGQVAGFVQSPPPAPLIEGPQPKTRIAEKDK
jgi:hypothetical protein